MFWICLISLESIKSVSVLRRVVNNCTELQFLHKTTVEEIPAAVCAFAGKVLVSVGRLIRVYDMGKRKLLRKCENKVIQRFYPCVCLSLKLYE